ncbi:MAG: EAL domain-containing protein, partial [Betaproteobacteria bacterium]|nr:EAL domain-containing protein [Betaproteobacteria bacterium]
MPPSSVDDGHPRDTAAANDTQRLYLESLAAQLTGWSNPRERVTQALERDEFILYTQTILPLIPGAVPACEFLVRLKEEEQHLAPPGAFIPVMEYYDLMPDLDRWVVSHVLDWYRSRMRERQILCSINLSGSTVRDSGFPVFVHGELERYGVPGRALCFEIAEHDVMARIAPRSRFAARLKALGCRFAIGSFGRDGVSFDSLKRLPGDFVKIDG